jgi:hypothetical protein
VQGIPVFRAGLHRSREIEWPCRMPVRFDPANKKAIPNISRNCGKSAGPVSGMRPRRGVPKNRDV